MIKHGSSLPFLCFMEPCFIIFTSLFPVRFFTLLLVTYILSEFTEHCSHTCSPGSTPVGEKCEVRKQLTSSTCFGLPRETSRRATRMETFKIACTSNCLCLESQHVLLARCNTTKMKIFKLKLTPYRHFSKPSGTVRLRNLPTNCWWCWRRWCCWQWRLCGWEHYPCQL